jgi:acetolactate synthase I/II/III large subunit
MTPGENLTGAEAVVAVLEQHGVEVVFAYPGTSELALCDGVDRAPGLRLVLTRGDKECAFMAAGASLPRPVHAVAIVHGARGLTNAAGGIAAARRNDVGTLVIAGLAGTRSARFLPPHGEPDLIATMGNFAERSWEAPTVPGDADGRLGAAREFVARLRSALTESSRIPTRPALFGIPQDVAEARWVPRSVLAEPWQPPEPEPAASVEEAVAALGAASRPLFFLDDHALRHPGLREVLAELTGRLGAPVFQLRYRRGPMLFERLRREEVATFLGWFNPFSTEHRDLLAACDLLVTVGDRNLYPRVVGDLPSCRKIAINDDGGKVRKNEYLGADDILLEGDAAAILGRLTARPREDGREPWFTEPDPARAQATPEPASDIVERLRTELVGAIGRTLAGWRDPVLVDDSQMFGGMISERYDLLPPGTRVFGDHSGFVGGGLATATGLAIGRPDHRVLCTLGDQGFINAFQGLVTAVQESARIVYLVCNNGESVSLRKQANAAFDGPVETPRRYLRNTSGLSYQRVAEAIGVRSWLVEVDGELEPAGVEGAARELGKALQEAGETDGPALVELRLPSDPDLWRGVWVTKGFE